METWTEEKKREFGIASAENYLSWKKLHLSKVLHLVQVDEFSKDFEAARREAQETYNTWMYYLENFKTWPAEAAQAFKQRVQAL